MLRSGCVHYPEGVCDPFLRAGHRNVPYDEVSGWQTQGQAEMMLSHDSPHLVPVLARHLAQFHLQAVICCIQLLLLLSHLQRRWLSQPPAMTSRAAVGLTLLQQLLAALVQAWINPWPPYFHPCAARHDADGCTASTEQTIAWSTSDAYTQTPIVHLIS